MQINKIEEELISLKNGYEDGIVGLKKTIDILEKNIKKLESSTEMGKFTIDDNLPAKLKTQLSKLGEIFSHVTNKGDITINSFIIHFLKVTLFFYKKQVDIDTSFINKITKILELARSFNENIDGYDLSSYVGQDILKDKAILTLLQILKIINVDIQKNTDENVSYNARKGMIMDGLKAYEDMIEHSDSAEHIKLKQLNEYYDYIANLYQNDNNEVLNNLINDYWNSLKTSYLGLLTSLNDYNINSGILMRMSPSILDMSSEAFKRLNLTLQISDAVFQFNAVENKLLDVLDSTSAAQSGITQTQSDLIAILNFYVKLLDDLKSKPIKDEQSVTNRINLEAHIQNNINMLVETMLTRPIPPNELPSNISLKKETDKKYSILSKEVKAENKTQQQLIKTLHDVKNGDLNSTSVTKNVNLLAASIANELLLTEFYALNIVSVGQKVNEKLLTKVPFGVVNAVKIAALELLKPKLKQRMTAILNNNIGSLKTEVDKLKAKFTKVNNANTNANTLQKERAQLALEIRVLENKYNNLVKNKQANIAAIENYIDNWIASQNNKIRGLGFSESLETVKSTVSAKNNPSIQYTCSAVEATVKQIYGANYFPLQFPNITRQKIVTKG
jgi:hypothetical protein